MRDDGVVAKWWRKLVDLHAHQLKAINHLFEFDLEISIKRLWSALSDKFIAIRMNANYRELRLKCSPQRFALAYHLIDFVLC